MGVWKTTPRPMMAPPSRPTACDREDLLASAREALGAQELARRVAAVYAEGQRHMDAREWQQALERFEEVQRLQPGYRDTEQLRSRARQELASPPTAEVPNLSGQEISQARSTLASKGLKLRARRETSSDRAPEGQIIEQYPEAGTEVDAGSTVDVTVSVGAPSVEVPDLAGKDHSEARTTLNVASLKLGEQVSALSSNVPEDMIVKQYPAAGTRVKKGSSVRLTVSSGPELTVADPSGQGGAEDAQIRRSSTERPATRDQGRERMQREVLLRIVGGVILAKVLLGAYIWYDLASNPSARQTPDLVGLPVSKAGQKAASMDYELINSVEASSQPKGTIISQALNPHTRVHGADKRIAVDLSGGEGKVKVPDVFGLYRSQAVHVLVEAGLEPNVGSSLYLDEIGDAQLVHIGNSDQRVTGTDPRAGTAVSKGTSVDVYPKVN